MKSIKKDKTNLISETEKRHADLKIKLKHYGISQSDFYQRVYLRAYKRR